MPPIFLPISNVLSLSIYNTSIYPNHLYLVRHYSFSPVPSFKMVSHSLAFFPITTTDINVALNLYEVVFAFYVTWISNDTTYIHKSSPQTLWSRVECPMHLATCSRSVILTLTLPGPSAGVSGSLDSYCSLKPLCSGIGEVVPCRPYFPHPLALCCHYPVSKCHSASIVVTGTVRVKIG